MQRRHAIIPTLSRLFRRVPFQSLSASASNNFSTSRVTTQQQQPSTRPSRVLTGYKFSKADACLDVSVRHAKFRAVGAQGIYHSLSSEGAVRLTLFRARAALPGASGVTYDFKEKVYVDVMALDIVNIVQSQIAQPVSVVVGWGVVRCLIVELRALTRSPHHTTTHPSKNPQITIAYSDPGFRGGKPISRRLDVIPPAAGAGAAPRATAAAGSGGGGGAVAPVITVSVTNDNNTCSITLSQQEVYLLRNLLGLSIPTLTGWQYQLSPSTFDASINLAAPVRGSASGGDDTDETRGGGESESHGATTSTAAQQQQSNNMSQQPPYAYNTRPSYRK